MEHAAQSRTRRVCQNVTSRENLKKRESLDPNVLLRKLGVKHDEGQPVANCVMALGSSTHNPPMVREIETGIKRPTNLDESETLMGATMGFTSEMDTMKVKYAKRARMIGNTFHYELVRTIFSEMMFVLTEDMMRKVEMYKVETQRINEGSCNVANEGANAPMPSADEKCLSGLTDEQMGKEFRERCEDTGGKWTKNGTADITKLRVELEKANTITYQVPKRSRYQTPRKMKAATLAATRETPRGGSMKPVAYEANQWIVAFVGGRSRIRKVVSSLDSCS